MIKFFNVLAIKYWIVPLIFFSITTIILASEKNMESRLKTSKDSSDLSNIADNMKYEPHERAKAISSIFANYIKPGQTISDMRKVIRSDKWLAAAKITESREDEINLFLRQEKDTLIISIALLPDDAGWSPWNIYLNISGKKNIDDFTAMEYLIDNSKKDDVIKIINFAISYPDGWVEMFLAEKELSGFYSEKTLSVIELLIKEKMRIRKADFWFIDFEGDNVSFLKFLKRFENFDVHIKSINDAKINKDGLVWDKETGKRAFIVYAKIFRWISQDLAEVESRDYGDSLGASGISGIIRLIDKRIKWEKIFSSWES